MYSGRPTVETGASRVTYTLMPSDYMVAGILSHTEEDGNEHPTAFYSKKLNDTQRVWSTIENETFAGYRDVKSFWIMDFWQ